MALNINISSAKGQEYFMKHLLGTKSGLLATPNENEKPRNTWREEKQQGN